MLGRPHTANVNILSGIKGLELQPVDEEGNPIVKPEDDTRIPEMEVPEGLTMLARTGTEQHALETMMECQSIKNKLAQDRCLTSMAVLERAMMMPDDIEWKPGERKYPDCGYGLMVNPFPKPKKKKKGKKGKKK